MDTQPSIYTPAEQANIEWVTAGWIDVEERLPWGNTPKPEKLEWDVYDPEKGVRTTGQHPHYWNLDSDDASEQVTHWRSRPLPPEE